MNSLLYFDTPTLLIASFLYFVTTFISDISNEGYSTPR